MAIRTRQIKRYARGISKVSKYLPMVAENVGKAYSKFRSANRQPPSGITTFQRDVQTTYNRKRAPMKVRRRARRQHNVFKKHMQNALGCKQLVTNQFGRIENAANNQALYDFSCMDNDRFLQLYKLINPILEDPNLASSTASEIFIKGVRQEVEVKNLTAFGAYIDLYYYVPRKDTSSYGLGAMIDDENGNILPSTSFAAGGLTPPFGAASLLNLGVTPFQSPSFTENFLVTKVKRVQLAPSATFTLSMGMRKGGTHSNKDWKGFRMRRGISSGIILIAQGEVDTNVDASTKTQPIQLSFHNQTHITASVNQNNRSVSYISTN
uniref:Capsid protein n=1 Tax=Red panda feces-associated circular DNA virus 6 TaxID=2863981 RepID=A0A8K1HJL4_9VIRU|nr:capsid protein [Red panda feces-associated circular DNA virus 6]